MTEPLDIQPLHRRIAELEEALARQARAQDALRGSRFSPGVSVFDQMSLELAHASGAPIAFIGALQPDGRRVQTAGFAIDRAIAPGFEYVLDGTACDDVVGKDVRTHVTGVRDLYPRDALLQRLGVDGYCGVPLFDAAQRPLGLIALLTRGRFPEPQRAVALLRVAAARASAELQRSRAESKLRSLFDSPLCGIVFWTSDGEITDANDEFLRMVQYSREDLDAGRVRWRELTPPEYAATDAAAIAELADKGVCAPYEKEYFRKNGSRVPILIGGARIAPQPLSGVAYVLDLSAKRSAEQAARESDELARQVFSSMKDGICVHDRSLRYVQFNPVMEGITGMAARDVLGKHPLEVFPILEKMGIYADLQRALEGEVRVSPDLPYHPKNSDRERWTRTECQPMRDSSGAIVGVIAMIRDITDLREKTEALKESQRRLSDALKVSQDRVLQLEEQVQDRAAFADMIGKSDAMQDLHHRLRLAAGSDVTVLLTGESGTGKELAAAAIHNQGPRKSGPFVGVNCSAIPEGLLESELFGHVKGAFTGATRDKTGLFQAAEGGTLFLDEVGDMSPLLQVKVLRALQEREIRRIGDEQSVKINVRLVTATNRNLPQLIAAGQMREDFYYRIRVFEIPLPPLRERKEDLPLIVDHYVREMARATGKPVQGIEPAALKALLGYSWPGNIRELKNAVEHAFVTVKGGQLTLDHFPAELLDADAAPAAPPPAMRGDPEERARILDALQRCRGRKADAARRLGISRVTLWHRMKLLGIVAGRRGGEEAPPG